ncbi:MAG: ubiquitin-like domain-containing protein [Actinomycetes bacterium]
MSIRTLSQAALVVVLAVTTLAFARSDKQVTLSVDGASVVQTTHASTVGDLLAEQNVTVGVRDVVVPDVASPVVDGGQVVVRHARLVRASVDGRSVQVWSTALTVDGALLDLGVRNAEATVSASRSSRVPLDGMQLTVNLPDSITIKHDQRRTMILTTAPTVGQAMREAGVKVSGRDLMNSQLDAPVVDGTVITITRVGVKDVRVGYAIAHRVIHRQDSTLYTGVQKTERRGHDGHGVAQYRVVKHDGVVVRQKLLSRKVVRAPVNTIIRVGTKPRPVPQVASASGLNWAALAACESGGNPQAVNPAGYYGLYQFTLGTWYSVGGTGNPVDASSDEQTYRAQLLYERSGAGPWPVCGPLLFS